VLANTWSDRGRQSVEEPLEPRRVGGVEGGALSPPRLSRG